MVVLDEEAGQGGTMPDLSEPVVAVSAAVGTLVKVGKETAASSNDEQLQQDLPRAWEAAEVASKQLTEAAATLKENARSAPGRRLLISGARGKAYAAVLTAGQQFTYGSLLSFNQYSGK